MLNIYFEFQVNKFQKTSAVESDLKLKRRVQNLIQSKRKFLFLTNYFSCVNLL